MRIFVTGASGWIGSATVPELIGAGHDVIGLARSEASATALKEAGAEVQLGSLEDVDVLRAAAEASDGVIHLAYNHDFSDMPGAGRLDRAAIDTFGDALAGTDKPFVIASGVLGLNPGGVGTELDRPTEGAHPRIANAAATLALADRGVRSVVVRLSPSVHGRGDGGFVPYLINVAREKGVAAYIGDGANAWNGVHRLDAAVVFRLAAEKAAAGSALHAVADEVVPTREIAEVIGKHLDVPVVSIAPEQAGEHFGWMGLFFSMDAPVSSALTREWLGWQPKQPGLIADLDEGHYFA